MREGRGGRAVYLVRGLAGLTRSSNQTNKTDWGSQIHQVPATRCEMGSGTLFNFRLCQEKTPDPFYFPQSRLSVSSEVQGQERTPVFYSGFLGNYTQTVTRKKVAGMEVASVRGLVF